MGRKWRAGNGNSSRFSIWGRFWLRMISLPFLKVSPKISAGSVFSIKALARSLIVYSYSPLATKSTCSFFSSISLSKTETCDSTRAILVWGDLAFIFSDIGKFSKISAFNKLIIVLLFLFLFIIYRLKNHESMKVKNILVFIFLFFAYFHIPGFCRLLSG